MKLTKLLPLFLLIGLMFTACTDDDDTVGYKGDLSVTLTIDGAASSIEGEMQEFMYNVILSKSLSKDIQLNFGTNKPEQAKKLFMIENPVVIKAGKTTGVLKIKIIEKPDAENILSENENFNLELKSVEGINTDVILNGTYTIGIQAEEGVTPLTDAQKALLAHYKENGMDLTKWIGKIPVEVKVKTAGDGSIAAFAESRNLTYNGYTYITLSENATEDKPLLKMTKNAFGLNDYLQYIFRHETIENTEYWNVSGPDAPPSPKAVLQSLGEERVTKWKDQDYTFDVSVDNLLVQNDNTIKFVYEKGAYGTYTNFLDLQSAGPDDKVSAVNFVYDFPLWNELVELAKGNDDLTTAIIGGGSIYPNNYIGNSGILSNEWGDGSEYNWVEPTSSYNDTEMTFRFNSDHTNSGGYDIINVKYTAPN